jgi:hypothetical protein
MKAERSVAMRDARRRYTQRKHSLVLAALEAVVQDGLDPTIAAIARQAGVGRKFIYDHPDLRAEIELKALIDAGQRPGAKIYEADPLHAARPRIKELEAEVALVKAASALFEEGGASPKGSTRLSEG